MREKRGVVVRACRSPAVALICVASAYFAAETSRERSRRCADFPKAPRKRLHACERKLTR